MEDFANASQNVKSFAGILVVHPCNCVELLKTLIKMADTELVDDVRASFERIAKSTPEVVFLGLAQIQVNPFSKCLLSFRHRMCCPDSNIYSETMELFTSRIGQSTAHDVFVGSFEWYIRFEPFMATQ